MIAKILIIGLAIAAIVEYTTRPEPTKEEQAYHYSVCQKYWLWHPVEWRFSCSDTNLVYGGNR